MDGEVTLMEMLQAREARVLRQQELLDRYGRTVISFCMNIAGPVKNSPLIRRAFREGLERLEAALSAAGVEILSREEREDRAGCEALWAVDGPGRAVKELCVELEDRDGLGRLFDLDVLDGETGKWDRTQLGRAPRRCLVCGREGKGCASRRLHPVEELQKATRAILEGYFKSRDRQMLAALAAKALLYEVCAAPKPGLVDRLNNGRHRDMDLFTFLDSTAALLPYFEEAARLGQETARLAPEETFRRLRPAGLRAEREMFRATGGVNTHKGAIFSLGTLCAAAGRLWSPGGWPGEAAPVLEECGRMCARAVREALGRITPQTARTAGERLYLEHGLEGIRGELARGLPAVGEIGLPALRRALADGAGPEKAGVAALLCLMARVSDTTLAARGGLEGLQWAADQARTLTEQGHRPSREQLEELDRAFTGRDLSPGGCADLLAITYFLHFLTLPSGQAH